MSIKTIISYPNIPNLVAWNHTENQQVYVWCKYGQQYHLHGYDGDGLRCAHCGAHRNNNEERYDSYNLVLIGEMPDILKKDQKRKRPKGPAFYGYAEEFEIEPYVSADRSEAVDDGQASCSTTTAGFTPTP